MAQMTYAGWWICGLSFLWVAPVWAERSSLFQSNTFGNAPAALVSAPASSAADAVRSASLFADQNRGSFFAPLPPRVPDNSLSFLNRLNTTPAGRILDLIAQAEAGKDGYDAVQYGAIRRPGKFPTQMTLMEIYNWISATPGQPHAIGRYQFIPATLRRLVNKGQVPITATFSPELQDQLATILLREAGLDQFMAGGLSRKTFMNNLAKIWAGLPNSSGKSHYHGYAGNKATMSWSDFDAQMRQINPG